MNQPQLFQSVEEVFRTFIPSYQEESAKQRTSPDSAALHLARRLLDTFAQEVRGTDARPSASESER